MALDPSIILSGNSLDVFGSMARGAQAGQQINDFRHQNALRSTLQEHGPGIMAGEQNALAALAQFDPTMAIGIQDTRQTMGLRANEDRRADERLALARQQTAQAAEEHVARMSMAEREAVRANAERAASMGLAARSPEEFDEIMRSIGEEELAGNFEHREAIAAGFLGVGDALARFDERRDQPVNYIASGDAAEALGLPGSGFFNVTSGPGGVSASPINVPAASAPSAAEQEIERMVSIGIPYDVAVRINSGVLTVSRDPFTNSVQVIDRSNGEVVFSPTAPTEPTVAPSAPAAPTDAPSLTFGEDVPARNARDAFGASGFSRNVVNTLTDTIGLGPTFPETQGDVADFELLKERLTADLTEAYDRQPPSWLLQRIADLVPDPASLTTGPDGARAQFQALERYLSDELRAQQARVEAVTSPELRAATEARISGLTGALARVRAAEASLRPPSQEGEAGSVQWRIIE